METICELVEQLRQESPTEHQRYLLDEIQSKAEAMEDRLLTYCNAIEDLGFERLGRDYDNQ